MVLTIIPNKERALVGQYKRALTEYDSDKVGDLDNNCNNIW